MQADTKQKSLEEYFNYDPDWVEKLHKTLIVLLKDGVDEYQKKQEWRFHIRVGLWVFASVLICGLVLGGHALEGVTASTVNLILNIELLVLGLGWSYFFIYRYVDLKEWWLSRDELYTPIEGEWSMKTPQFEHLTRLEVWKGGIQIDILKPYPWTLGYKRTLCFEERPKEYLVVGLIDEEDGVVEFEWVITNDIYSVES